MTIIKTLALLPGGRSHEHAAWLIGPVGQSRDSDLVETSNWHVATAGLHALDPEGIDHEIHRFGHWAVGWIEEIATRPGSACAALADELREALAEYPFLDEDHHSALEYEAVYEAWDTWQCRDVKREVGKVINGRQSCSDACLASEAEHCTCGFAELIDNDASLDDIADEVWSGWASELGEVYDGSYHFGRHDYEDMADRVIALVHAYHADLAAGRILPP